MITERKSPVTLPKLEEVQYNYHLRSGAGYRLQLICKTKLTQDSITFKY